MKIWYWSVPLVLIIIFGAFYTLMQDDKVQDVVLDSSKEKTQRVVDEPQASQDSEQKEEATQKDEEVQKIIAKKQIKKIEAPQYDGKVGEVYEEDPINQKEAEKLDAYFKKAEEGWNGQMKDFIANDLGLNDEAFQTYQGLKSAFERDKMEAFETFHDQMAEKHGENYSYSPTEDEEAFSAKINEEYLERMRKLFGEEGYLKYLEMKDRYNEKLKKEQDPKWGYMSMDL